MLVSLMGGRSPRTWVVPEQRAALEVELSLEPRIPVLDAGIPHSTGPTVIEE